MNSSKRRIHNLEKNNLLQPMVKGTSKLFLTDIEYNVCTQATKICKSHEKYSDLTPDQKHIIDTATRRMRERVFDLLEVWVDCSFCYGNDMALSMFKKRFLWFIRELSKESAQWIEADEIEEQHKDDNDGVDYVDEYFCSQPDCYTPESWDKLENEIDQAWIKHWKNTPEGKKCLKKNTK